MLSIITLLQFLNVSDQKSLSSFKYWSRVDEKAVGHRLTRRRRGDARRNVLYTYHRDMNALARQQCMMTLKTAREEQEAHVPCSRRSPGDNSSRICALAPSLRCATCRCSGLCGSTASSATRRCKPCCRNSSGASSSRQITRRPGGAEAARISARTTRRSRRTWTCLLSCLDGLYKLCCQTLSLFAKLHILSPYSIGRHYVLYLFLKQAEGQFVLAYSSLGLWIPIRRFPVHLIVTQLCCSFTYGTYSTVCAHVFRNTS